MFMYMYGTFMLHLCIGNIYLICINATAAVVLLLLFPGNSSLLFCVRFKVFTYLYVHTYIHSHKKRIKGSNKMPSSRTINKNMNISYISYLSVEIIDKICIRLFYDLT